MIARWLETQVHRRDEEAHSESWLVDDADMLVSAVTHPPEGKQDVFSAVMKAAAVRYDYADFVTLNAAKRWAEEKAGLHAPDDLPESEEASPMIGVSPALRPKSFLQRIFG